MSMPALFKGRLSIPVIGAPLFIISVPDLVIAQCKAGIVGSFPSLNARPPALLDEWLVRIKEELAAHDKAHPDRLSAPFAVNQIVHKSNNRLDEDMEVCAKWQVPMVITSLGAREDVFAAVAGGGGIALHDVINDRFSRKAIEKGGVKAMYNLGFMYEKGLGVEKNLDEASKWYKLAAARGNESSKQALKRLEANK